MKKQDKEARLKRGAVNAKEERGALLGVPLKLIRQKPPPAPRKSNAAMQAEFDSRWTPERIAKYQEHERSLSARVATASAAEVAAAELLLPDQSEVDPTKIKHPVLTRQGYVAPLNIGAAPAHLRHKYTQPRAGVLARLIAWFRGAR